MIRQNPVKRAIREGKPVLGMYSETLHPTFIEVMAKVGLDFVILDTEHNAYGLERVADCIRASDAAGITPFVRVYENSPALINKALEVGAMGIVFPHTDTPELARQAVASTKYPPAGIRGVHPSTRASGFTRGPDEWDKVWRAANEEIMVIVQALESESGIANIEEIAAVPGIDLISLGTGDMSQVLRVPGQKDHPKVKAVRERAFSVCQQQGIGNYVLGDIDEMKLWYDRGVRVFVASSDVATFQRGSAAAAAAFRQTFG